MNVTTKTPMTLHGAESMRAELEQLKRVDRPRIVAAIAEARAHGDLKENAEYHAAKDQQGMSEAKIRDIEAQLSHAQIIDVSSLKNEGKVVFGSTVKLINIDTDEPVTYQIVGDFEADLKHGKISYQSPIVRAIIGKLEGDEVAVNTPKGEVVYEIGEVLYI